MPIPLYPPRFDTTLVREFYTGLEAGELRLSACAHCYRWLWYPPEVVPCHPEAGLQWRRVSSTGSVYTFTTVERSLLPGDHRAETPYTVLLVESDDAPGARIPSLWVNAGERLPSCGMRVRLSPIRAGHHLVAAFEPADESGQPPSTGRTP